MLSVADARKRYRNIARLLLQLHVCLAAAFLLAPIAIAVALAFSSSSQLTFPPPGLSLRWFNFIWHWDLFRDGLFRSLVIAVSSAAISTIAGTAAAIALNHYAFPWRAVGRTVLRTVLMLPLMLPGVALGIAILFALPNFGLGTGIVAVTLGHSVIGIPYVAYLVLASLFSHDFSVERASANLGASPWQTFRWITLPLSKDGCIFGFVITFLISFDNVSLSIFLTSGDTLPLRLIQHIQFYADPSVAAASVVLILLSLVLLLPLAKSSGFQRLGATR